MSPQISVIMSVYNGEKYVSEAIESILKQTVDDFEFIIVNDGSTDLSATIVQDYAAGDNRIVIVRNPSRLGLTQSLNRALARSKGEFIARQDADDISVPDRLQVQLAVMNQDPQIGLVGSSVQVIDEHSVSTNIFPAPEHDTDIRWQMLFRNVFKHASIVIRAEILKENGLQYNEELVYAQDYDLWSRMLLYCRGVNISRPLLQYRVHTGQISARFLDTQQDLADQIGRAAVKRLGLSVSLEEQQKLRRWSRNLPERLSKEDMAFCRLYFIILAAFAKQPYVVSSRVRAIRRFMVNFMLKSISVRQWDDLLFSGLYCSLLKNHLSAALVWPVKRLIGLEKRS